MVTPADKLAEALQSLHNIQANRHVAIRSADLSRIHRERLLKNGFLQEVMKGWYIPTRPDQPPGESTAWYATFWPFCSEYLTERFGDEWCLSPEQSLNLHVGDNRVPHQLIVRSEAGTNNIVNLPQRTSILTLRMGMPRAAKTEMKDGLRIFTLGSALSNCAPNYFRQHPTNARAALATIRTASDLLAELLDANKTVVAGRIAGAFRNIGKSRIADDIVKTMRSADHDCREEDPFEAPSPILSKKVERSPQVTRMQLMWQSMRESVLKRFPQSRPLPRKLKSYLDQVQATYMTDAYHSLSIEGYRVTPELIERVRSGLWKPDKIESDREQRDALAARGYWLAYQSVRKSLGRIVDGDNAGDVADDDHGEWYRQLLSPSVTANLLRAADLAGYRNDQVYIRHSAHVPPDQQAVRDMMPAFFDLLREEQEASIRVVLGHFFFVYIHPYMDGNGRIGRFLMNLMLCSGGYPWTVVPVTRRKDYLLALEKASTEENILPLTDLIAKLVEKTIVGQPEAK